MQWFKQYVSLKENSKELVTMQEQETIKHLLSRYVSVHYHQFRKFVESQCNGPLPVENLISNSVTVLAGKS